MNKAIGLLFQLVGKLAAQLSFLGFFTMLDRHTPESRRFQNNPSRVTDRVRVVVFSFVCDYQHVWII